MNKEALKPYIKWGVLSLFSLCALYVVMVIHMTGRPVLAVLVMTGFFLTAYIYTSAKAYTFRYLFPGLVGMGLFVVLPLAYTINMSFTNYSSTNLLTFQRATNYLLDETYRPAGGDSYRFTLHPAGDDYRIQLVSDGSGAHYLTEPFALPVDQTVYLDAAAVQVGEAALESLDSALPVREVIQHRNSLQEVVVQLPSGAEVGMAGLREFATVLPLFKAEDDGALVNQVTGEVLRPNFESGFYETEAGERVPPGFRVQVGLNNYERIVNDPAFQGPFVRIFGWTVAFAGLTVLFTLIVGLGLAVLLSWEKLNYRGVYRLLLFLPYAVPGFISILVFRGLFNENFGEINLILDSLFGLRVSWFSDPALAKTMILIVNTWLGYPYIMILCMGLLKAIPNDLYEASSLAGVGPLGNLFKITAPLVMKPLLPLLIASFAFNFNNFVLIALLTGGRPDFIGTTVPSGTTDILVTYTYRIAFEDAGRDFGLAAAISAVIFIMVAIMSFINLRVMKVDRVEAR
ncbi:maltose ABC transporter permease MalF [Alkalilimnicola ehrlichii]|uniref:Maltose/maltodextrin transport system permease protein n=1 Tax=Alkalilimnicola ehrlichii TaxID=351052 RepID=A0A3E0WHF8_9GAMM|nr:maltose ABC transporter permease MalF [Alkalilimnicola ehrlichii]RFA25297.1 maltose ABC transporter permease MalF [Alkalilimnicola ehrlichii]RFA32410.1 maltose ABC transporter permease MalF [Alkalilimnicola ehrlichii]